MTSLLGRVRGAWSAFNEEPEKDTTGTTQQFGHFSGGTPPFANYRAYRQNSITSPVFNRIALDVSMVKINHVRIKDKNTGLQEIVDDDLQDRLNLEANIDQTGQAFIQDLVYSLMDEGVIAVVPIDTDVNPKEGMVGGFNIKSMRIGQITEWFPSHVRVNVYNDQTGLYKQITMPKDSVAIIQNPLYAVVNSENSTLQRLILAIKQLDKNDSNLLSDSLNLILQLPYLVRGEKKTAEAKRRLAELQDQMNNNRFGIGYIDGTEKITQLNKPLNNTLLDKVLNLQKDFLNQVGMTPDVFNGTADEGQMKNYFSRSIDPLTNAIIDEFDRKFITKSARTQGHILKAYRNPFTLVSTEKIGDMAKNLIDARIAMPNELRPEFGFSTLDPNTHPIANELSNPNVDTADSIVGADGTSKNTPDSQPPQQEPDDE